jgi:hypothetical protein
MRICILGRTEFDIALAKAMNQVGIILTDDVKKADYVLSRESGQGIKLSNDREESGDIYLPYGADITTDIKDVAKWKSDVLYIGEWDKRIAKLSVISSPFRVCFFTGDEHWAENWCGSLSANYRNINSIIAATEVFITTRDSMSFQMARFLGKAIFDVRCAPEQIIDYLIHKDRYPVEYDRNNTIFDRLKSLLTTLGGKAAIYNDLCEFAKQERIECLGLS